VYVRAPPPLPSSRGNRCRATRSRSRHASP
jgi:hypothetical protein